MKIVPVYVWKDLASADKRDRLVAESEQPVLSEVIVERRTQFRRLQDQDSYFIERIALDCRVLIIEGISGSGKDTVQTYLKKKLKDRDVYDYSEGEVLHSWKQLQIEGILKLRVKFMRTLSVHVFILQLDENEIDKRSLHPERSGAWQKFQQQIVEKDSFRDRLERQQRLILEAAKRQQIPYSVIKLPYEPEIGDGQVRISKAPSIVRRGVRMNAADAKISRRKRHLPPTL